MNDIMMVMMQRICNDEKVMDNEEKLLSWSSRMMAVGCCRSEPGVFCHQATSHVQTPIRHALSSLPPQCYFGGFQEARNHLHHEDGCTYTGR